MMDTQSDPKTKTRRGDVPHPQSLNSPSNSSQGVSKSLPNTSTGRPPTTTVLRSAMYYQNRIIVPEVKTRPYQPNANSAGNTQSSNGNRLPSDHMNGPNASLENSNNAIYRTNQGSASANATSRHQLNSAGACNSGFNAEMDSRGVDIVVTDTEGNNQHRVKKKTIWRKCYMCLQDNRMKGNPNADAILAGSNPQEYRILKKVLNIIFLTIGTALLISVVIVIIYTTVADG